MRVWLQAYGRQCHRLLPRGAQHVDALLQLPLAICICSSAPSWPPLQVREKDSNIDSLISPIEDMYALLLRYEVWYRTQ